MFNATLAAPTPEAAVAYSGRASLLRYRATRSLCLRHSPQQADQRARASLQFGSVPRLVRSGPALEDRELWTRWRKQPIGAVKSNALRSRFDGFFQLLVLEVLTRPRSKPNKLKELFHPLLSPLPPPPSSSFLFYLLVRTSFEPLNSKKSEVRKTKKRKRESKKNQVPKKEKSTGWLIRRC